MGRGNYVNVETLHQLDVLGELASERHHYLGVVPLGADIDCRLILDIKLAGGKMGTEEGSAEEDLLLHQICELRLRPVDEGRHEELQVPVSQ